MTEWAEVAIGVSGEGRPITAWCASRPRGAARVLVVAGQHGDERGASRAAQRLIGRQVQLPIDVAVVPVLNPDGRENRTRSNASGIDLNRDHLILEARETRALHAFVRDWRPDLVLDLHNFPSRRRDLIAADLVLPWHLCADVATHPAAAADHAMIDLIVGTLRSHSLAAARYTLLRPKRRTRHSTPYAHDLRNVLALRYEAATLLVEGRSATRADNEPARAQLRMAFDIALDAALEWAASGNCVRPASPRPGDQLPVGWRWRPAEQAARIDVWHAARGRVEELAVPRYASSPLASRLIDLPAAYAVPADALHVIDVLDRHGFERTVIGNGRRALMFPVDQRGGRLLAVMLEPRSRNGLARRPELRRDIERVRPVAPAFQEGEVL